MLQQPKERVTIEAFDEFIERSENADRNFEYIGGEVFEVVSNSYSSEIAAIIIVYFGAFLLQHNIGRLTGADGGYIIAGERYIPDAAFISYIKQPKPCREAYNPNPPDLVVEVLSPSNDDDKMRIKIANYLLVGVIVWVVNPDTHEVEIYAPGHKVKILTENDTLDGGNVLPGFILAVKDVFPKEDGTAE
jgi:Uma2 family endonuclease